MSQEQAGRAGRRREVVVIGASAGGVEALVTIARELPPDLPAAVFVVLHLPEGGKSYLSDVIARAGPFPVTPARDDVPLERGTITVAPPDRHLVIDGDRVRLVRGPKVNAYRPAVDVLFHSAARSLGRRVIGVILSGTRSDGTLGLRAIKRHGGAAIVQADPIHQGMPASAIRNVDIDAIVPLHEIARTLTMMVAAEEEIAVGDEDSLDETPVEAGFDIGRLDEAPGDPTVFRCPECGGALWELADGELHAYVCHVGHSFSSESFLVQQGDQIERALWSAVRLLEERAALNERLAERMEEQGLAKSRSQFETRARRANQEAEVIRGVLEQGNGSEAEEGEAA